MQALIIGNGPAGISAAIYLLRGGMNVKILGKDGGALAKAKHVENYYGFSQAVTGEKLLDDGIAQAKRLGAEVLAEEVVNITVAVDGQFEVTTTEQKHFSDAVVLASGAARVAPKIKDFAQYEGKGVSFCAVCDAFFYRGEDVAVLGSGEYALHEAQELAAVAKTVTLLTNGESLKVALPSGINVVEKKIASFEGEGVLSHVCFEDGERTAVAGVFVAIGVAGSSALARQMGVITEGNVVVVDREMNTNIPGFFAAGDCTGGMLQVAKASYEGAMAGTSALNFLREKMAKA